MRMTNPSVMRSVYLPGDIIRMPAQDRQRRSFTGSSKHMRLFVTRPGAPCMTGLYDQGHVVVRAGVWNRFVRNQPAPNPFGETSLFDAISSKNCLTSCLKIFTMIVRSLDSDADATTEAIFPQRVLGAPALYFS